jgi:hypothetical protein
VKKGGREYALPSIITPQSIPTGWKLSIFTFISSLSLTGILNILAVIVLIFISIFLIRKFVNYLLSKKDLLVFLELTFPSITSKTAYASEQLFSLIHALASQHKFIHKLFGYRKQYSLEIVATKEQGIRYILAISSENAPIIRKNLLSYLSGLKIREIKDYLLSDFGKENGKSKLIEFKLSNDFVLPLREHKMLDEHDPIAYLTGNMTKLRPDELMVFQAVVTPLTKSGHSTILRHINVIQQCIYGNQTLSDKLFVNFTQKLLRIPLIIIMFVLKTVATTLSYIMNAIVMLWETPINNEHIPPIKPAKANREEIQNPYELELQEQVKKKIGEPLFETSLRLFVRASDSKQTNLRISGFLASLGSLGGTYQSLTLKSRGLLTLWQPYLPAFIRRQVSLFDNPILSASELTDIYHFPYTETTKTEDMVKSKNQPLPAPLSFKQSSTHFDNVFAKNTYGETETIIGQTLEERRLHTYILGATGSGKSTLLSNMIYNDILSGKGVAVLDPHGQLIEKIMEVIPKERIDDVVWFAPDDDGYPIALNLMELPNDKTLTNSQLQKQKSLVASSIISIIEKFYDARFFGPRMEYVLRNAILTALEIPDSTIKTIVDILTKTKYRKEIVKGLDNEVLKDYWVNEFARLGSLQRNTVISPITNKIGGLLSSPINYNILKQAKSKLNFDDVINSGKILLCDLSKGKIGEDESSFFGSLVIAKIQLAALRRALIPEEERRDFFLYVDEFQNFATPTFAELVSEARKYHLATILAHQSVSQIENRDIIKIILANVGTVICFKTANPEDEQFILPIFSPEVTKHEIANLPLYNFYMKVSVGQAQDTFLAQADNFTIKGKDETVQEVIAESRKNYATPMDNSTEIVSQQDKSPEIQNTQFAEEKPENFNSYPIQYRSKAGNGKTPNNNKQNVTPNPA